VYRSVGKAFMLATKPELEKEAQESLVEVSQNEEKFENQAKFLMSKVKENEQQMGELMRQQSGR
jgi:chaperonin cofactor prefoldin